tara:strand:- start:449 stop:1405 length:957 start_codon:yes stop_codon:yes gene_type:complete
MLLKLNDYQKNNILKQLPNFELFYDNIIHKKVFDKIDNYILVPNSKKSLLYFTYIDSKYVAAIITLNKYNQFTDVRIFPCCFNESLVFKKTIIYGYEVEIINDDNIYFLITDIIYYKSTFVNNYTYENKFKIINNLLSNDTKQISFCKDFLIIALPVIYNNYYDAINNICNIPYNISSILYIKNNYSRHYGISYYNIKQNIIATFKIKPSIQNDIYYAYYKNNNEFIYSNILLINSYKCSIFMNKMFRKIKENINLDLLEESDEEDEFENINLDKFVDLYKEINIKCRYHYKFKKWIPIEISYDKVINKKELDNLFKI